MSRSKVEANKFDVHIIIFHEITWFNLSSNKLLRGHLLCFQKIATAHIQNVTNEEWSGPSRTENGQCPQEGPQEVSGASPDRPGEQRGNGDQSVPVRGGPGQVLWCHRTSEHVHTQGKEPCR